MPVVRSQLLCHIFKWLTLAISDDSVITGAIFHLIKVSPVLHFLSASFVIV